MTAEMVGINAARYTNFNPRKLPALSTYEAVEPQKSSTATSRGLGLGISPNEIEQSKLSFECGGRWLWKDKIAGFASYFPRSGTKTGWKPATLRAPVLSAFIFISILLIALLEVLAHQSSGDNGGGVAFGYTVNDLSAASIFSFQYLPTIISVCYSMIWGWVDLDTKRLEPWFQLSKPEGASAADSLLLQYPFDFLAFVPVRAARRKHWSVFNAGLAMMIIFWVITPLQSAIFSTGQVTRTRQVQMGNTASLSPVDDQVNLLSTNFLKTAYGILWLSQKLPSFTTSTHALLPFEPVADNSGSLPDETWSTNTTAYTTNLTCVPAVITPDYERFTYFFGDNDGCTTSSIELPSAQTTASYLVLYVGYYPDFHGAKSDIFLQSDNCTEENSHKFLALWASAASQDDDESMYHNLTALFCTPTYYAQTVYATVNASDGSVLSSNLTNILPSTLSSTEFNITNFEYIIGTGISPSTELRDYPDSTVVHQYPRLLNYSLASPMSNMVGYAFGTNPPSAEALYDATVLRTTFTKAHQILFSMAINILMIPLSPVTYNTTTIGVQEDSLGAIIFVRPFSIAVEVALGIVAILCGFLWYTSYAQRSTLTADPASISRIMSLMVDNREVRDEFKDDGTVTATVLEERIINRRYRLKAFIPTSAEGVVEQLEVILNPEKLPARLQSQRQKDQHKFKPILPKELNFGIGGILLLVLFTAIGLLGYLFWKIKVDHGLQLPTTNSVLLSLLENLIPTAFASILEPFWVVLNRILCLLQPFEELRRGNTKAISSIDAKYTSLPPQLAIWRAMRARHFLLTAVCGVAILMNVLAVSLSGLFMESQVNVTVPHNASYQLSSTFSGVVIANYTNPTVPLLYDDHFYVLFSNLTSGTSLPEWTDQERFYIPFDLDQSEVAIQSAQRYQGLTRGFGGSVSCTPLTSDSTSNDSLDFEVSEDNTQISLVINYRLPNGSTVSCTTPGEEGSFYNSTEVTSPSEAASAFEVMTYLASDTIGDIVPFCANLFLAGWTRLGPAVSDHQENANDINTTEARSLDYSFMSCAPTFSTAIYNVTVSPAGYILGSEQVSATDHAIPPFFGGNDSTSIFEQANQLIGAASSNFVWHTDTLTRDWPNSLLKLYLNTTDLVDPQAPLPNATALAPVVENMYQSLIAIMLSRNTQVFTPAGGNETLVVRAIVVETRIFMSSLMFYLTLTLLVVDLVVASFYYARRPRRFLPRMPTNIASILGYVSAGHAFADIHNRATADQRFSYGWFHGLDKQGHVGIDLHEHIVPLYDLKSGMGRKKWNWNWKR